MSISNLISQQTHPTMEDIYTAVIETDRGVKEKVRIFDIALLVCKIMILPLEFKKKMCCSDYKIYSDYS